MRPRSNGGDHLLSRGFLLLLAGLVSQKHHFQEVFNSMGQLNGKYLHWAVTGTILPTPYSLLLGADWCSRKLSSLPSPGLRPGSHEWADWGRQSIWTTVQSSQCHYARNPYAKPHTPLILSCCFC